MKFTNLITAIRSIPSDLVNCTVKQLRTYASLFRVPTSIRNKEALIGEIKSHLADFTSCLSALTPPCDTSPVALPAPSEETPSESCTDVSGTFIDTAQFHLPEPLSGEQARSLNKLGIFPTPHKLQGSEIFCYLNDSPKEASVAHIRAVSRYLQSLNIGFSRTMDKTYDKPMTEEDFKSGKYFPEFKWNKRDRQWEHTDSNGVMTRIYDKTAELIRRGTESPKWLKGKLDNYDRGVSYAVHTVRVEARHTSLMTLQSAPLPLPREFMDYTTPQTYVSASSDVVSLIARAINSGTKRKLAELVQTLFASIISHFDLGRGADKRFSELKAALKKLHPELATEISKIRRKK